MKTTLSRIEKWIDKRFMDCSEYKTGSAKFIACRWYNEVLYDLKEKNRHQILALMEELKEELLSFYDDNEKEKKFLKVFFDKKITILDNYKKEIQK